MHYLADVEGGNPLQVILDGVPSMLAYWDRDLRCKFANEAYTQWFGISGKSLIGTSLPQLLGPDLFESNRAHIQAALRGEPQEFEKLVPGPGGARRPSLAKYLPHIVDGQTLGFVVEVTDVTPLYEAREELRRKVDELQRANGRLAKAKTALEVAQRLGQIGSWEYEVDSGIVTWSDALYEIFGLDPSKLPPSFELHDALYTADSLQRLQLAVQQAREHGTPYILELEYIHSGGAHGWLEARGAVTRNEQGEVDTLHGTARVVTDRHMLSTANSQGRSQRPTPTTSQVAASTDREAPRAVTTNFLVKGSAESRLFHEIIYSSLLVASEGAQCVVSIANSARKANKKFGITGVLVFDGERFCQHFEGPTNAVGRLFERISADPRHTDVRILHEGPIEYRHYSNFTMGLANTDDPDLIVSVSVVDGPEARAAFLKMLKQLDFGY